MKKLIIRMIQYIIFISLKCVLNLKKNLLFILNYALVLNSLYACLYLVVFVNIICDVWDRYFLNYNLMNHRLLSNAVVSLYL